MLESLTVRPSARISCNSQSGRPDALLVSFAISVLLHLAILEIPVAPLTGSSYGARQPIFARILKAEMNSDSLQTSPAFASTTTAPGSPRNSGTDTDLPGLARELNLPELPVYYSSRDLAQVPEPLHPVQIPEPPVANLVSGTIRLKAFISESGSIERIVVAESSLPEIYVMEAQEAFRSAQFTPGRLNDGTPVPSLIDIEVKFGNGNER